MIKIEKVDLAIEIINLKIAKEIKKNTEKDYREFKRKILNLEKEREQIYLNNTKIIEKVLNQYLNDVRM